MRSLGRRLEEGLDLELVEKMVLTLEKFDYLINENFWVNHDNHPEVMTVIPKTLYEECAVLLNSLK